MASSAPECLFCRLAAQSSETQFVYEDADTVAFLDHRPVFPGHCLLIPKKHFETLSDLPPSLIGPLFAATQRVARAVETGLSADGSFVAINNKVSQSVPHLHVHIVPRRRKDGLRGFFWPRTRYESAEAAESVRSAIVKALQLAIKPGDESQL